MSFRPLRLAATSGLAAALLCACAGMGSTAPAVPAALAAAPSHERFVNAFLDDYWAAFPSEALRAGRFDHVRELPAEDAAWRRRTLTFYDTQLQRLDALDLRTWNANQRADVELMRSRLRAGRWNLATFKAWQWDPSQYNVAHDFELILDGLPGSPEDRLRAVLDKLQLVPGYYAAAIANIDTPTLEHVDLAIEQNTGALATFGEALAKRAAESGLAAPEKREFETRRVAAHAAIEDYIARLRAMRPALAAGKARPFRIGRELYEQKFQLDQTTSFQARELYEAALAEKARLHDQMAALSSQLWPTYFPQEAPPADRLVMIRRLLDKLSLRHVKREELVDAVRRQIPELEGFVRSKDLLDQDPTKPLKVRETPLYQRGAAGASVDAPGPYNPGADTFYNVTPLDGESADDAESYLREYNHWMLQILNIHEAIPGHYTQLVHANKSPSIVKSVFGDGATVEGWAVYGERMMLTAGYGNHQPEMWLFWMKWNLRTVCNTILDYAVHTQGMTREQMMDLVVREGFQETREAQEKWRRATLTSVQLTSYFAGYLSIWRFREEEEKRLGPAFDLKAFHNRFLSYGSAPVPVIKALMHEDIRSSTWPQATTAR